VNVIYFACECSLVDSSSLNTGNLSLQIMLKLPTGETVPVPSIVIVPSLPSPKMGTVVSQSPPSAVAAIPTEVMAGLASGQPSVPLHFQALPSLPAIVHSGSATSNNSQLGAAFDLPESGLTALGIAASTREVGMSIRHCCICVIGF